MVARSGFTHHIIGRNRGQSYCCLVASLVAIGHIRNIVGLQASTRHIAHQLGIDLHVTALGGIAQLVHRLGVLRHGNLLNDQVVEDERHVVACTLHGIDLFASAVGSRSYVGERSLYIAHTSCNLFVANLLGPDLYRGNFLTTYQRNHNLPVSACQADTFAGDAETAIILFILTRGNEAEAE